MHLEILSAQLSVCKLKNVDGVDFSALPCFLSGTDRELSLVCPTAAVPPDTLAREDGWRAFRVAGQLDFSLVGILSELSGVLAAAKIGIFAVSTYDTDYILTRSAQFDDAIAALRAHGCTVQAP